MDTQAATVRDWSDAVVIGPVRLHMHAAGNLVVWRIDGPLNVLAPGQRVELAFTFWNRVSRSGTIWDVYAVLFPRTDGGLRRGGPRNGVSYVDYD